VFLDVEFVSIYPQKSPVQGSSAVDDRSELSWCHFLNSESQLCDAAEDMAAIEARLARIEVTGERLPPAILKLTYR
jgi:hypothetical protein